MAAKGATSLVAICDYTFTQHPARESDMEVSVREFKNQLSRYLARAQEGEELVITSHKQPVARVTGLSADTSPGILRLLQSGQAEWHGGKPKGARLRPVLEGKSLSDMVIEDRG